MKMVFPFSLVLALMFALLAPLALPSSAQAQSWRQEDPSAIVLPGQPGNATRRDSGGSSGGIFRIFRFEPQRQTRRQQPSVQSSTPFDAAPVLNLPPPKDPDAITVVAFGDEFADQLREGLVDRFDGDPLIEAVGVSIPGSGLTQIDEMNWNVEALQRLDGYTQVGAVVVALGYSDRRALIEGDRTYQFGTRNWIDAYRNRITSFALTLLSEGYPVIFAGLPPMGDPQLNEDARLISQVIEEAIAPTRARFVSVYAGFADVEGNYVRSGPNLAGQVENLRRSEGVFFNRSGREKYAQFIEQFIPREGRDAPEPEVSAIVFEGSTGSDTGVGPVILMTSGFADPTATLVGDPSQVLPEEAETVNRLVRGAATTPPPGRADDFAWPEQPEG
ncbi:MAG: DUF459 domain-containing protein [Devosiaceae bacterium]